MAADLDTIRTKVRRLTRSISENQLTTTQLDDYINTFILYDFPEHLRLFTFKTTFSFYCEPYIDVYETDTSDPDAPLFNFKNKFITVKPPLYIAGFESWYSQSRTEFFRVYPLTNSIENTENTGDGATTNFTGTIPSASVGTNTGDSVLLRNNVVFSSIATSGDGLILIDDPQDATTGNMVVPNDTGTARGTINYLTGVYNITFPTPPADGEDISSQVIPVSPSRPQALLYFDNKFTLRPVPDKPYKINIEVFQRPTDLINDADEPELEQYWQFIAYGAARKVFQDRMDLESLQMIEPEYKQQEILVLRRTIVQQTNQRVATIYTQQTDTSNNSGFGFGGGNGGNF